MPRHDGNISDEHQEQLGKLVKALQELRSCYGIESDAHETSTLEEHEFIITEMTLDPVAMTHAADRLDFPGQVVRESEGSKTGQTFGCAGGKQLANEGGSTS